MCGYLLMQLQEAGEKMRSSMPLVWKMRKGWGRGSLRVRSAYPQVAAVHFLRRRQGPRVLSKLICSLLTALAFLASYAVRVL